VFIVAGDDSQMRVVVVAAWVVLPVVGELAATVVSIWTAVPKLLLVLCALLSLVVASFSTLSR